MFVQIKNKKFIYKIISCFLAILIIIIICINNICIDTKVDTINNDTIQNQVDEQINSTLIDKEIVNEIIITERNPSFDGESAEIIWNLCLKYSDDEQLIASIMGAMLRESSFKSNSIAGWHMIKYENPNICEEFTATMDKGLNDKSTKEEFIQEVKYHYGGYGLMQWSSKNCLELLYDFASEWNTSLSDAEMQCAFVFYDLENHHPEVINELKDKNTVRNIALVIGCGYEGTCYYDVTQYYAEEIYKIWSNNNEEK